jgi:hypothetical protein
VVPSKLGFELFFHLARRFTGTLRRQRPQTFQKLSLSWV